MITANHHDNAIGPQTSALLHFCSDYFVRIKPLNIAA